jgi:hypothetical protein
MAQVQASSTCRQTRSSVISCQHMFNAECCLINSVNNIYIYRERERERYGERERETNVYERAFIHFLNYRPLLALIGYMYKHVISTVMTYPRLVPKV